MSRAPSIAVPAAHRDQPSHHSRAAAWLLAAALVAVGACGTVDVAPSAKDGAGGNGAAGAGAPDGAAGTGGSFAAGGAGGAPAAAAGSSGSASSGGAGGTSSDGASGGAGGSAGAPGVSDVQCPYDVTVQRGCAGQIIDGSPCDVCHDGSGALLRCSTDPRAGARMYCVPDCSYCHT